MGEDHSDPGVIRSIAVTAEDVVAAVESRRQRDERVLLRVTPPFSGRMRARIHVPAGGDAEGSDAVHLDPTTLLEPGAPPYPRPGDTEDELRTDPDVEYTVERHHERHREALERWRDRLPDYVADRVTVETAAGSVTVDVAVLG
ncbi:MAG: hypothetical protein V5A44_06980 [Haloarculaceae archaeon]